MTTPVKSKKAKFESSKVFEFVLVRFDDEGEDGYSDNALSDSRQSERRCLILFR